MSDSAPLIMNLGAEVTPAVTSGVTPGNLEKADGNGFAGMLGAMMQTVPKEGADTALTAEQVLANQLLLARLVATESELQQEPDKLADFLLQHGKPLPSDETEVSWQSLFGNYDSTDPDNTRLIAMMGDDEGYRVSELTPEGVVEHVEHYDDRPDSDQAGADADLRQAMALLQERIDQARLEEALPQAGRAGQELRPDILSGGPGTGRSEADLKVSGPGNDSASDPVTDLSQLRATAVASSDSKSTLNQEHQQKEEGFKQDLKGMESMPKLSTPTHQTNGAESNNLKPDINQLQTSAQDTSAIKPQAVTNMAAGAAAYSAVSGVNGTATPQQPPNVIASLTVTPDNPAWGDIVGNRVHWMVNQNIQEAQIKLNPPDLGMLEVRVNIGQDQQTHVSFSSPHSQVRDALENAMPRLREMFGANGLNLGNVDVSHQSMSDQRHAEQSNEQQSQGQGRGKSHTAIQGVAQVQTESPRQGNGMLDLYA